MLTYFCAYAVCAWLAWTSSELRHNDGTRVRDNNSSPSWVVVWIVLLFFIGGRYRVGGDWAAYVKMYRSVQYLSFEDILSARTDPGYAVLNWVCAQYDFTVIGVNLFCGAIFSFGLISFCCNQPAPWLSLAVAMPYMVVTVAMGYSRQGVALGFSMLALRYLSSEKVTKFVILVLIGTTFHKSAIILIPLAGLASAKNKLFATFFSLLCAATGYYLFVDNSIDEQYENYVTASMQSGGAFIRAAMNVVPAVLLLVFGNQFSYNTITEKNLWRLLSISAVLMFVGVLISSATTVIDRIGLYLIPLQIFVMCRLPVALGKRKIVDKQNHQKFKLKGTDVATISLIILIGYAAVLFTWLNYGEYSVYWQPYRFFFFDDDIDANDF